jgi:hypothetical protein
VVAVVVTILSWAYLTLVVAVPLTLVALSLRSRRHARLDGLGYRAKIGLHTVRRRLDTAQFNTEVRRAATDARRELRDELRTQEDRGRR